eukprot:6375883-Prymnesium_polylepis.1
MLAGLAVLEFNKDTQPLRRHKLIKDFQSIEPSKVRTRALTRTLNPSPQPSTLDLTTTVALIPI